MDAATKLFFIRKTLIQMLLDREYLVDATKKEEQLEDFKSRYDGESREVLTLLQRKKSDPSDQIYVFFPDEEKVGVKSLRTYVTKMKESQVSRAIVVVRQGMSPFAKQALAEIQPKYKFEQFTETELLVNITEHQLVPEHVRLTKPEKKALLERYKLKESQLPRMQSSDPVARYYGLERGEVVKITRPSETAGRYVTYRLVS
ncbi:DNA-directed RNA polymerase [Planoprotostelium fungivorum]|uniref:DNA-directed RNA polymerase n=1 Tax=Planoprotostelium fungivorum TaxID=1890364 RepID=A0A2P6NTF3_9EUKA|nr:DNA-directed RNA polymerase [Planoprotostelium fungivorum]